MRLDTVYQRLVDATDLIRRFDRRRIDILKVAYVTIDTSRGSFCSANEGERGSFFDDFRGYVRRDICDLACNGRIEAYNVLSEKFHGFMRRNYMYCIARGGSLK